jgi:hypothetical protein
MAQQLAQQLNVTIHSTIGVTSTALYVVSHLAAPGLEWRACASCALASGRSHASHAVWWRHQAANAAIGYVEPPNACNLADLHIPFALHTIRNPSQHLDTVRVQVKRSAMMACATRAATTTPRRRWWLQSWQHWKVSSSDTADDCASDAAGDTASDTAGVTDNDTGQCARLSAVSCAAACWCGT